MKNLAFLLFLFEFVILDAQNLPNLNHNDLVESYKMTTYEYYTFPDTSVIHDLSEMEKFDIKKEETETQVNIYKIRGQKVTEMIFLKHASHPAWLEMPNKIIMTDNESWTLDKKGNVVDRSKIPKVEKQMKSDSESLLEYSIENFMPLSDPNLGRVSISGIEVKKSKPNLYKIKTKEMEMEWDTDNFTRKTKFIDNKGQVHSDIARYYKKDKKGSIIPISQVHNVNLKSNKSKKNYNRRTITVYSDYQFKGKKGRRSEFDLRSENIEEGNPFLINSIVQDELKIQIPFIELSELYLEIIDLNGQIKLRKTYKSPKFIETLNLSGFSPGLYICRMKTNERLILNKFIIQ